MADASSAKQIMRPHQDIEVGEELVSMTAATELVLVHVSEGQQTLGLFQRVPMSFRIEVVSSPGTRS